MMTQAPRLGAQRALVAVTTVALGVLCAVSPARAQEAGGLVGSIYDQTGGALQGVAITVRGVASREGHTDVEGAFEFQILPPGDYEVAAHLNGFEPARRTVRVQPGER